MTKNLNSAGTAAEILVGCITNAAIAVIGMIHGGAAILSAHASAQQLHKIVIISFLFFF